MHAHPATLVMQPIQTATKEVLFRQLHHRAD